MGRSDLSRDAALQAAHEVEVAYQRQHGTQSKPVATDTVAEALSGERIIKARERDITRVLFISRNSELLNPAKQSLDGYVELADLFDEVHILILREGIPPKNPFLRVSENVWIYTASAKYWWQTPKAGFALAETHLSFAGGFRPDLIVARDPFESALVAYRLGKKYQRPTQLHILNNYIPNSFFAPNPNNFLRRCLLAYLLPKFLSVRTLTESMLAAVQKKYSITDLAVLPRFQNYLSLVKDTEKINLTDKYRPYLFVMLYVGPLNYDSSFHWVLDAVHLALKNPQVGLLVLGDGPAQSELQKRAKALKIETQIIFEPKVTDINPYLKSADLLLVSDTDRASEELVLKAAAAGIPMVMTRTERREDIFTHGENALLSDEEDKQEFTKNLHAILKNTEQRQSLAQAAQTLMQTKFIGSLREYQEAYRTSIEQAMFVTEETAEDIERQE